MTPVDAEGMPLRTPWPTAPEFDPERFMEGVQVGNRMLLNPKRRRGWAPSMGQAIGQQQGFGGGFRPMIGGRF